MDDQRKISDSCQSKCSVCSECADYWACLMDKLVPDEEGDEQ